MVFLQDELTICFSASSRRSEIDYENGALHRIGVGGPAVRDGRLGIRSAASVQGAYTYFLDKTSMGQIKSELGTVFASGMAAFRTAYVVVGEGQVVTVAFARTPAAANYWRRKP